MTTDKDSESELEVSYGYGVNNWRYKGDHDKYTKAIEAIKKIENWFMMVKSDTDYKYCRTLDSVRAEHNSKFKCKDCGVRFEYEYCRNHLFYRIQHDAKFRYCQKVGVGVGV